MKVNTDSDTQFRSFNLFVIAIFVLGFAVRIYHINTPPLDFEPDRHYHSFILARNYFFQSTNDIPEWRKGLWKQIASEEYIREPPILEHIVALVYRVTGKEQFLIS